MSEFEVGLAVWVIVYGPVGAAAGALLLAAGVSEALAARRRRPPEARAVGAREAARGVLEAARGGQGFDAFGRIGAPIDGGGMSFPEPEPVCYPEPNLSTPSGPEYVP